jgi:salicylate hydroxylase
LTFEDGSTAVSDILVGADGIKSSVRASLLREKAKHAVGSKEKDALLSSIDPYWTGQIAYRSVIPVERVKALAPNHRAITRQLQYLGKNGFILAYPISQGKLINFVAFHMRHDLENTPFQGNPVSIADPEEFASPFSHWEPEARILLTVRVPFQIRYRS